MTRIVALVLAGLLACGGLVPARAAMGRRAQCRTLCGDAVGHCHDRDSDERKPCRRQIRTECRRNGPALVCRPSYSGTWVFTPTGALMDTCDLAARADLAELTRMVVHESPISDDVRAELGPGRDSLYGYLRPPYGSTVLEGETRIDECVLVAEVTIGPSASLPRYAAFGTIHSGGSCGEQRCLFEVDGRWDWRSD